MTRRAPGSWALCPRVGRRVTSAVRRTLSLTSVFVLSGCLSAPEFEEDRVVVQGQVLIGGQPAQPGSETLVYVFVPGAGVIASTNVDDAGRYAFDVRAQRVACRARLFGFTFGLPYPIESNLTRQVAPDLPECVGVIEGPTVRIPEPPPELQTVRVSGTVTVGGFAVPVDLRLRLQSLAFGPVFLDATTSGEGGVYELEAEVPTYYCDDLTILTNPASSATIDVDGCGENALDIAIS